MGLKDSFTLVGGAYHPLQEAKALSYKTGVLAMILIFFEKKRGERKITKF